MGDHRDHRRSSHILVVDDEEDICQLIAEYLLEEGYRVSTALTGAAMTAVLAASQVDLVILDLMLPDRDGFAVARSLRVERDVGIIIVSGRSDTVDRIVGLEMGSDDYLVKPFEMRELGARVKSVLRRRCTRLHPEPQTGPQRLNFSGWSLDLASRELRSPAGKTVPLTASEFALLSAFVENANKVMSRDRLAYLTHGREAESLDRSIDVLTSRLRRKLGDNSRVPQLIKGVRGVGYVFVQPVAVQSGALQSVTPPGGR